MRELPLQIISAAPRTPNTPPRPDKIRFRLNRDAALEFQALCWYPRDPMSRRDYLAYAIHIRNRMTGEGPERYEASAFSRSVETLLHKGIAERAVAGVVTIYLYQLIASGVERPKLRHAAQQTEALFAQARKERGHKILEVPWRQGKQDTLKLYATVSSVNNIENKFRKFSMIGSLMAGRILTGVRDDHGWDIHLSNQALQHTLSLSRSIEHVVFPAVPELFPMVWSARATRFWGLSEKIRPLHEKSTNEAFPLFST